MGLDLLSISCVVRAHHIDLRHRFLHVSWCDANLYEFSLYVERLIVGLWVSDDPSSPIDVCTHRRVKTERLCGSWCESKLALAKRKTQNVWCSREGEKRERSASTGIQLLFVSAVVFRLEASFLRGFGLHLLRENHSLVGTVVELR